MSQSLLSDSPIEHVFVRRNSIGNNVLLHVVTGVASFIAGVVGFVISRHMTLDSTYSLAITGLPASIGLAILSKAHYLSRAPVRIVIDNERIRVETRRTTSEWTWDQIGGCLFPSRRSLEIVDTEERPVIRVTNQLDAFDILVELVKGKMEERTPVESGTLRVRENKRRAIILGIQSLFLLLLAVAGAFTTYEKQRGLRLIQEKGVQGAGIVEALRTARIGPVRRVIYRVTSPSGKTATRNVAVDPDYWKSLLIGANIPVIYVPDEPAFSHLVTERVDRRLNPVTTYSACAGLFLVSIFCLFAAFHLWPGTGGD